MPFDLPVNFEALAKGVKGSGGYPVQISGADLMRNYVASGLDVAQGLYEETAGFGGYQTRKLLIPTPSANEDGPSALLFSGELYWGGVVTEEVLAGYPTWAEANDTYVDWGTIANYPTWAEANEAFVAYSVLDNYPTWAEANDTYVDWGTIENYPTWAEANDTYVDWGTIADYPTWAEANEAFVAYSVLDDYPTWAEANAAYVAYSVLAGYPTWAQANAAYATRTEFDNLTTAIAACNTRISGLGVDASCADGAVTVWLTGQ